MIASQEDILYVFHDMGKTEFCVAIEALEGKRGRGRQTEKRLDESVGSFWVVSLIHCTWVLNPFNNDWP